MDLQTFLQQCGGLTITEVEPGITSYFVRNSHLKMLLEVNSQQIPPANVYHRESNRKPQLSN